MSEDTGDPAAHAKRLQAIVDLLDAERRDPSDPATAHLVDRLARCFGDAHASPSPAYTTDDYPRAGCTAAVDVTADGYTLAIFSPDGVWMETHGCRTADELTSKLQSWTEGHAPQSTPEDEVPIERRWGRYMERWVARGQDPRARPLLAPQLDALVSAAVQAGEYTTGGRPLGRYKTKTLGMAVAELVGHAEELFKDFMVHPDGLQPPRGVDPDSEAARYFRMRMGRLLDVLEAIDRHVYGAQGVGEGVAS